MESQGDNPRTAGTHPGLGVHAQGMHTPRGPLRALGHQQAQRRPGCPPGAAAVQTQEEQEAEAAGFLSSARGSVREERTEPGSARRAGAEETRG